MNNKLDPETLKIPAYMRKKMIVSQSRQKLILTALDRKDAGLKHDSTKALAPPKKQLSSTPRNIGRYTSTAGYAAQTARLTPPRAQSFRSAASVRQDADNQLSFGSANAPFAKIGEVTHYLEKIGVAIIMLSSSLKTGDSILIEGDDEIFPQVVEEMQIDRKPVKKAKSGSHIGLKVGFPAAVNGKVYLSS